MLLDAQLRKLCLDPGANRRAFGRLALRGGLLSRTEAADYRLPYCDAPVRVGGRAPHFLGAPAVEWSRWVPCRKCDKCLTFRRLRWRDRMLAELTLAKRSWFVTLTYSPIALAGVLSSARSSSAKDVERAAYGEVQKWLKRTRQHLPAGARLRYVAIFERGDKHGRAHYHLLVHEVGNRPVLKRHLQQTWHSISNASLVRSAGVAAYLLKYLTKSVESRVRASAGYGGGLVERKVRSAKPPGYDAQNSTSFLKGVVLDHRSVLSYFVGGPPRGCEHSHVSTALAGALVSDAQFPAGYSRPSAEGVSGEHEPAAVGSFDVASFVASFRAVAFGGAQPRYGPRGGGGRGGGDGGWRSPRGCTFATAPPCAASAHGTDGSL